AAARCAADAEFLPNISREEKVSFLRSLTLLSVPATYGEAFGMYLLEAWAAGVPVVQPRCAAFPEMIGATGAGRLFEPANTESLMEEWEWMLAHPAESREMGRRGRDAVESKFSLSQMAERFLELTREKLDAPAAAH
ncbi:MAG: glycosyltransferase family 4 protein, partial [Verrucomicrobiota bacterium]|nr:glycosyltransferase family 4 protein [Verrucomicrobiota bacterium]